MDNFKKNVSFPDPLAPFSEKKSDAYGLSIAQLISSEWFGSRLITSGCEFMNRKDYVRQKRLFVRGENDLGYFKNQMAKGDNDLEFINIDWKNINWAEKFSRIVSNGISDKNYKLDVRATDKLSTIKKEKQKDYYLKEMRSKKMLLKAKEELGIDLMPKTFIPEDEEEMEIFMAIKERPKIEIAEEILIDYVLNTNEWSFLEGQFNKDLVDVGLIVARIFTSKSDGVKLAYVDPENYIHSRVTRNDFADKTYEGVVETITINDIKRESGFDEDTLRKIGKSYGTANQGNTFNYDTCRIDDIINYKVNVCRFAYKTTKTITYKKKIRNGEAVKASRKDDTYIAPEREDAGMISNTFDVWFEGNYVIGTNYIYGYKECENQYDDVMNKAMSPFITMSYDIYENRLRSFLDNIEAPARQLQKISLKIQHLVSELTPDLKEVDLDQLAELDDGKGGVKKEIWETALALMSAKGVVFKKRVDMGELGMKDSTAVRPYGSQQGSALGVLLNTWAHYYNLIRENTGINPARDGSIPANSLVGINQLASLASNTVTANIVESAVLFKKKISENISTRIHSIFSYSEAKKIKEIYANVVGQKMIDFLEVLKDRHLHEFGFTFEMNPTQEDIKKFEDRLTIAQNNQEIDVYVAYQAEQIARVNVKDANRYLSYHSRKRFKQNQEQQLLMSQEKSKNDAMAAQSKVQAELQSYQARKQIDLQYESQLAQIELTKAQAIQQISIPKEQREFEQEVYLTKIQGMSSMQKEEFKEDRKDSRTKIQAGQQSKMVEQRQKENPSIDFEAEDNWFKDV